jgi:hypothetical protein
MTAWAVLHLSASPSRETNPQVSPSAVNRQSLQGREWCKYGSAFLLE